MYERVSCLKDIKDTNDFKTFLVNFKRLNNIIKSNKLLDISNVKLNIHHFESSEEQEIYDKSKNLDINLKKYLKDLEHQGIILKEIISLCTKNSIYLALELDINPRKIARLLEGKVHLKQD